RAAAPRRGRRPARRAARDRARPAARHRHPGGRRVRRRRAHGREPGRDVAPGPARAARRRAGRRRPGRGGGVRRQLRPRYPAGGGGLTAGGGGLTTGGDGLTDEGLRAAWGKPPADEEIQEIAWRLLKVRSPQVLGEAYLTARQMVLDTRAEDLQGDVGILDE